MSETKAGIPVYYPIIFYFIINVVLKVFLEELQGTYTRCNSMLFGKAMVVNWKLSERVVWTNRISYMNVSVPS